MTEFLTSIMPNVMDRLPDFYQAIGDTLIMVGWSGSIAFVLGLFLGIVLTVTKPGGILEQKVVYQVLDKFVNFFRSIPFIILLTWVIPLSRAIMGTAINVPGAIVPLIMGTVPFFSRQVEGALDEIDHGLIEAGDHLPSVPAGERLRHCAGYHHHRHQPGGADRHGRRGRFRRLGQLRHSVWP